MRAREVDALDKRKAKVIKNTFIKPKVTDDLGKNPLLNNLDIPVVRKKLTNQFRLIGKDTKGNDVFEPIVVEQEYINFTKLYLLNDAKEDLYKLDLRAKELYLYILHNLNVATDFIAIDRIKYMEIHKIKSENTYLTATKALAKETFINPVIDKKDVFWINPLYFFRGDRVKKYKEKVRVLYDYTSDNSLEYDN